MCKNVLSSLSIYLHKFAQCKLTEAIILQFHDLFSSEMFGALINMVAADCLCSLHLIFRAAFALFVKSSLPVVGDHGLGLCHTGNVSYSHLQWVILVFYVCVRAAKNEQPRRIIKLMTLPQHNCVISTITFLLMCCA